MSHEEFTVDIYKREKQVFLFPCSETLRGGTLVELPPEILPVGSDAIAIGERLFIAAGRVRKGVDAAASSTDEIAMAVGEKSWSSMIRRVTTCMVERQRGASELTFYAGKRERGGFASRKVCQASLDDPKAIGEAILRCLTLNEAR